MSEYKKQTTKKTKVIGTQTFINRDTGSIEEMQVVSVEDRDFNFHKIWLGHIINSLDLIGNQKVRFVSFLLESMDSENKVVMTLRQMANKANMSLETIRVTIKALKDANFLTQINQGAYQINPDVIFKGSMNKRLNVLYTYSQNIEENKKAVDKPNAEQVKLDEKTLENIEQSVEQITPTQPQTAEQQYIQA